MNKIMSRQEFAELAAEETLKLLPDGQYEAKVQEITKASETYTGVLIKKKGSMVMPSINADAYYAKYIEGACLKELFEEMADIAQRAIPTAVTNGLSQKIADYEAIKDMLAVKLFPTEKVRGMVHKEVAEGLSMVPYIILQNTERGLMAAQVHEAMVELWDMDEEQVIAEAFENGQKMFPTKIIAVAEEFGAPFKMYAITSENSTNGAANIFRDGVLEEVKEMVGGDFYLLPSSVNEFIATPYVEGITADLLGMVTTINKTLDPHEKLADAVWSYRDGQIRKEA